MENNMPTDETLAMQIQAAIEQDSKLKQCIMCRHYDKASGYCDQTRMKMMPYVRGCNGKFFETNMEFLVNRTKKELQEQALQCEKMENMLAISITTANSTSCFFTRLHKMVKELRAKENDKERKRLLYKDLEMVEGMQTGMKLIDEKLAALYEIMDNYLEDVDRLYRMYVEPQTNRMFTRGGKFDSKQSDGHLNNAFEICRLIVEFIIGCIGNLANCNKVFGMLRSLVNHHPYGLTHKDADSFKLKGFEE